MIKIYHNPRCQKSRNGLQYVKSLDAEVEIIDYLKTGLTPGILHEILLKSNLDPSDIIRTGEEVFRRELKGKHFTREEWIRIIIENPQLLKRPFVVGKHRAILADCPEAVASLAGMM
jgi:arsenate reductase (glutaredoxin)